MDKFILCLFIIYFFFTSPHGRAVTATGCCCSAMVDLTLYPRYTGLRCSLLLFLLLVGALFSALPFGLIGLTTVVLAVPVVAVFGDRLLGVGIQQLLHLGEGVSYVVKRCDVSSEGWTPPAIGGPPLVVLVSAAAMGVVDFLIIFNSPSANFHDGGKGVVHPLLRDGCAPCCHHPAVCVSSRPYGRLRGNRRVRLNRGVSYLRWRYGLCLAGSHIGERGSLNAGTPLLWWPWWWWQWVRLSGCVGRDWLGGL